MNGAYVRVIERWQSQRFDVFVFDRPPREAEAATTQGLYRYVDGDWKLDEPGDPDPWTGLPRPSLSIPQGVLEQLLAQSKKLMPSLDRDDAVSDARATRDRLLTLVEGAMRRESTEAGS